MQLKAFGQGIYLGLAAVLPGMSGGAAAVALGLYEDLLQSVSRWRVFAHWRLLAGALAGVVLGAKGLFWLLLAAPDDVTAILLGTVLAGAWLLGQTAFPRPGVSLPFWGVAMAAGGFTVGWSLAGEPLSQAGGPPPTTLGWLLAGALGLGAMVIPGGSGATTLIMLGVYDDLLLAIDRLQATALVLFALGGVMGMTVTARAALWALGRWPTPVRAALFGLMSGSARALLPASWGISEMILLVVGFWLTCRAR